MYTGVHSNTQHDILRAEFVFIFLSNSFKIIKYCNLILCSEVYDNAIVHIHMFRELNIGGITTSKYLKQDCYTYSKRLDIGNCRTSIE
jgi:hypothetical protein